MILRVSILSCALIGFAFSDTLYLRNGSLVEGNYAGGDTRNIKIVVGDHVETYPIGQISRLEFGPGGVASTPAVSVPAQQPARDYSTPSRSQAEYNPPPPPPPAQPPAQYTPPPPPTPPAQDVAAGGGYSGLEIPAGTTLVVRMVDAVDSERATLGQTFHASLDEPIIVNGQTVVPQGSDVIVKLVKDQQAGTFTGQTSLTLDVASITVNGRSINVSTSDITQASGSKGKSTAVRAGGGAVVGAILGGLIGGGKGAAVGATSGAGLGAGSEVVTKGGRIKIPSETRLSFVLQQTVRV